MKKHNLIKNNKAVVLIYVLFLVTLTVTFGTIFLSNNSYLLNINTYFEVNRKLNSDIVKKSAVSNFVNNNYNLNGTGFIDNISCPTGANIIMSGSINSGIISSVLVNSGSIYCYGTYLAKDLKIFFNTGFTDFTSANYDGSIVTLTLGLGNTTFSDTDNTLIDFSAYNYLVADGIDDNFNSDNYRGNSTGSTEYLSSFQDDDDMGRRNIYGIVEEEGIYKNIFWNTTKTSQIISNNINNTGSFNKNIGDVSSAYLYFDIDKSFDIKLVSFNKNNYDNNKELISLESLEGVSVSGSGYLQDILSVLSLSLAITGNEYIFDFVNNDYAIFLRNTGTGNIVYSIKGETASGSGIYINPIDDSDPNYIKILGNEILIEDDYIFIGLQKELIYEK